MTEQGIGVIVLAAGASRRFGDADKLWHEIDGLPLIEHTLRLLEKTGFAEAIVVGSSDNFVRLQDLAAQYHIGCIANPNSSKGIGTSISTGIAGLNTAELCGVAIFLGDLPFLKLSEVKRLQTEFLSHGAHKIVRPSFDDQPGHPAFFPGSLFDELLNLVDDTGAQSVIRRHKHLLEVVPSDSSCVEDIDTENDLL